MDKPQACANISNTPTLTTNTNIEIPEYIKTFRTLTNNSYLFNAVQQEYLGILDKLTETCQPLAKECDHFNLDALIGYTKKLLTDIDIEDISSSTDRDLFFSYTSIRQALIEIEEFLRTSDDENKKTTVYLQLFDAFGVCVQGLNSKVYDVYQYMQRQETSKQDINHQLYSKCNLLIKDEVYKLLPVLQEEQILEQYLIGDEIHVTNPMIEVSYNKLNLTQDVDNQFVVYDAVAKDLTREQKECILSRLDYPITRYKIITFVTEIFSQNFNSVMNEIVGISEWHTRNITPSELTSENTGKIDIYFCSLINKYFNIQDDSKKFSISHMLNSSYISSDDCYSFANIKDALHKFIATNIDKFPHNMLEKTYSEDLEFNIITKKGEHYSIKSFNSGYFYKTDSTDFTDSIQPISIDDLYSFVDTDIPLISKVPDKLKVPIIIQALENKSSDKESVYAFFNDINNISCLKQNKYVMKELLSSILSSEIVKQKIAEAIDLSYIKKVQYGNELDAQCAEFFIDMSFVSDNELYNSLLRRNKVNLKTNIEYILPNSLYSFLCNISTDNLKKLVVSITTEDSLIDKFVPVLEQCIQQNNFRLLNIIFENDILLTNFLHSDYFKKNQEECISLLYYHEQGELLGKILSNPSIDIKQFSKMNILHYATICHNKQILENITAKLSTEEIQKYLIDKGRDGMTPLDYAIKTDNNTFFNVLEPYITREILLTKVNYIREIGYNVIMHVLFKDFDVVILLINKLTRDDIIAISSSDGETLLMIAANEKTVDAIFSIIGKDNEYITKCNAMHQNCLIRAMQKHNVNIARKILEHCNDRRLLLTTENPRGPTTTAFHICLSPAKFTIKIRMSFLKLLLEYYGDNLPKEKNYKGFSILGLAITFDNLDVFREILPYCDEQMLKDTVKSITSSPIKTKSEIIEALRAQLTEIQKRN